MAAKEGLSVEGYRAQVSMLGLKPTGTNTGITTIHRSREMDLIPVANPEWQTSEQRQETIDKLKLRMGVGIFPDPSVN